MSISCGDFDVTTADDWRSCGRINSYIAIGFVLVIVLLLIWMFSGRGLVSWSVAGVGLLIVAGMIYLLPEYMAERKANEHAGLHKRVDDLVASGAMRRDYAVEKIKTELGMRRMNSTSTGDIVAASFLGNVLANGVRR